MHDDRQEPSPPSGTSPSVTIVIKALNEEGCIARAIESATTALAAAGVCDGEVILADSRSEDRTAEIAAARGIAVARLSDAVPRSCGIGPQLGYQHARGDFVCLIDGDMALAPGFLREALAFLRDHPEVAGVGGGVRDVNVVNLEFDRRARRGAADLRPGPVDRLNGGGLYRRGAIATVGYFSDRNLHGYEEFDLAVRLRTAGWSLHRLATPFVDHYGHTMGGYPLLLRRITSRYLDGIGELLRGALGKPHLRTTLRDLPEIRLWLAVYVGWALGLLAVIALPADLALAALGVLVLVPVAGMSLRYRSLPLGIYAFVAWNAHAFGMARGFLRPRVAPDLRIEATFLPAKPKDKTTVAGAAASRSAPARSVPAPAEAQPGLGEVSRATATAVMAGALCVVPASRTIPAGLPGGDLRGLVDLDARSPLPDRIRDGATACPDGGRRHAAPTASDDYHV
ncbi:glycosyltransferase family A protein [Methylobacterium sp. Leaf466]|uniref:glycosyltransferase n=1 Tax=Methylobacterium sp. Leaf466 TaxID=1736386 RepID=UPI0009EA2226|nr:glycosyltransferase family A protein [Methylobacterium sp. Leaf466]